MFSFAVSLMKRRIDVFHGRTLTLQRLLQCGFLLNSVLEP